MPEKTKIFARFGGQYGRQRNTIGIAAPRVEN
jgi:hypothetical protein